VVIDFRPGVVIQGIYYYETDGFMRHATTNDLYEKLDVADICEQVNLDDRQPANIAPNGEYMRYRKINYRGDAPDEPDFNLRLRNVRCTNAALHAANPAGVVLIHDKVAAAVVTAATPLAGAGDVFESELHSGRNFESLDPTGGDGSAASFDQLALRYGSDNSKSILGIPLPVAVRDEAYDRSLSHAPIDENGDAATLVRRSTMGYIDEASRAAVGYPLSTAAYLDLATGYVNRRDYQRRSDNLLGYGDYVPLAYDRINRDGAQVARDPISNAATAYVAPLVPNTYGMTPRRQPMRNPRDPPESHDVIAQRLARRGRRNEIGVAMQTIEPGRQGDIMLHDGI
jgi:hypothetical protein